MRLDHLAVSAGDIGAGADMIQSLFGVAMAPGGVHPAMGTHNRLLSLGPDLYLEVIAIDPAAPPPGRPRWFDLDRFLGPPRLTNWIVGCDDLPGALRAAPSGSGQVMDLARGDLRWRMAVPRNGRLPFDGMAPALISWQGNLHPAALLPDVGCRLVRFEVSHPAAGTLARHFPQLHGTVAFRSAAPGLSAEFDTPNGRVTLSG